MMNEDMSVPVQVELHADNLQPLDPVRNGVGVAATVDVVMLKCKNGLMSFSRRTFRRMILTFSRTILHRTVKQLVATNALNVVSNINMEIFSFCFHSSN
jgi:hypothetical protein